MFSMKLELNEINLNLFKLSKCLKSSLCQNTYYEVTLTSTFHGVSDVSYTDTPIGICVVTDHSAFIVANISSHWRL